MSRRARFRIAVTLARRSAARSVGRSVLIVALIAIPICGLSGVLVVAQSMSGTAAEKMETSLGHTEARLGVTNSPSDQFRQDPYDTTFTTQSMDAATQLPMVEPSTVLPAGTRIIDLFAASATVRTGDGIASIPVIEGESWDRSLSGHFDLVEGKRPTAPDDILVTRSALAHIGAHIGDTIELVAPRTGQLTIVGLLEDRTAPSSAQKIFVSSGDISGVKLADRLTMTDFYLPTHALSWPAVQELNTHGINVISRQVILGPLPVGDFPHGGQDSMTYVFLTAAILGVFGAFEIILLAGAAFAVNARQQQRTLAIVASVGGSRSTLFQILTATGLVLGALGGIIGVALGIGLSAVFMALSGNGSSTQYYGFHLNVAALAGVFVFSALIGWVASIAPAVSGSKLDVIGALRGARRPPKASRRKPIIGLVILVCGVAIALVGGIVLVSVLLTGQNPGNSALARVMMGLIVVGPIAAQIGLALSGPLLLRTIARIGSRGSLGVRLATQDAARNPARTVPAFAAILSTVFVAIFVMCAVTSNEALDAGRYQYQTIPGQAMVRANDGQGKYYNVADAKSALSSTLDVTTMRVLSSVPDYQGFESKTPEVVHPKLSPPATAWCPNSDESADFDVYLKADEKARALIERDDPRCSIVDDITSSGSSYWGHIWVGDAADISLMTGKAVSTDASAMLARGGAVSLHPIYAAGDRLAIKWYSEKQSDDNDDSGRPLDDAGDHVVDRTPKRIETIPVMLVTTEHPLSFGVVISPQTAARLGMTATPSMILASLATPPTDRQLDATRLAISAVTNEPGTEAFSIENGPSKSGLLVAWALLALTGLIAIASSAVAIGLARFDGRADDATLESLGAGAVTRRSIAFWQSLLICGLGTVLGSLLGILPAFALELPGGLSPFAPPVIQIVLAAVGLPFLVATASWLLVGRRTNLGRRLTVS